MLNLHLEHRWGDSGLGKESAETGVKLRGKECAATYDLKMEKLVALQKRV